MSEKLSEQLYTLAGALRTTNPLRGRRIAHIARKVAALEQQLAAKDAEIERLTQNIANMSDGHHTLAELYEHRHSLFSVVCKQFGGWKAKLHEDGTMYGGWFLAGVDTPKGTASYHLPLSWWSRFDIQEIERAPHWDGCTPNDVIGRIAALAETPAAPEVK